MAKVTKINSELRAPLNQLIQFTNRTPKEDADATSSGTHD
jgi:hypothetical protein